jgi:hypothetical protein
MITKVNRNPSRKDLRDFGIAMIVGFGVIGGFLLSYSRANGFDLSWRGSGAQMVGVGLWGLGLVVAVIAWTLPSLGKTVYVVWMTVATYMGMVMLPVLLTVLFVVMLPVFSLIRFSDPLRIKLKRGGSYWESSRKHEATLERMRRPF